MSEQTYLTVLERAVVTTALQLHEYDQRSCSGVTSRRVRISLARSFEQAVARLARYKPTPPVTLDTKLADCPLSTRSRNVLARGCTLWLGSTREDRTFTTVGDLTQVSRDELRQIRDCGDAAIREFEDLLFSNGFAFKPDAVYG